MFESLQSYILAVAIFCVPASSLAGADVPAKRSTNNGVVWGFEYDEQGRLTSMRDPGGKEITIDYEMYPDDRERFKSVTRRFKGGEIIYEFDRQGRLCSMKDLAGGVDYTYDELGRLSCVKRRGAPAITYTHDLLDRISSIQVGDFYRIENAYDFLGRLKSMDTPAGTVKYEYQTGQNEVIRTLPNGVKTFWKRQVNGQLESIIHGYFKHPDAKSYSLLAQYTYAHGPDGRIATIRERSSQGDVVKQYAYDTMGRLVRAVESSGRQYGYEYDLVGNRTKAIATGKPDQNCTYDWAGRLTAINGKPCTYDPSGNLTKFELDGTLRQYRFNTDNRLAEGTVGGQTVQYRYDGHGRLVVRKSAESETRFIPDPLSPYWQPLVMIEPDGTRTLVIWDGAVPVATIRNGKTEWRLHDHLGSVRLVANTKGDVTQFADYDPFGSVVGEKLPQSISSGYVGHFNDADLQLTLARSYDRRLGAFLQPDPQKRIPTGSQMDESLYAYCGGDPVNFYDSDGHEPVDVNTLYSRLSTKWESTMKWLNTFGKELFSSDRPGPPLPAGNEREGVIIEIIENALSDSNTDIITADSLIRSWRYPKNGASSYSEMHPTSAPPTAGEWQAAENYIYARKYVETGKGHQMFHGMIDTTPGEAAANRMAHWQIPAWEYAHFWGERLENWGVKPDAILRLPQLLKGKNPWGRNEEGWQPQTQKTIDWQYRGYADGLLHVQNRQAKHGIHVPISIKKKMNLSDAFHQRRLDNLPPQQLQGFQFWHSSTQSYDSWKGGSIWPLGNFGSGWREPHSWDKFRTSPSSVGGVYLGGALDSLEGLGKLKGVRLDANGNLLLVGDDSGDIKLPPLRLDDVATIFRSVYIHGEGPSVTIDPNPVDPENSAMIIKHGKGTEDTYVGWVLYEADRLMKSYNQGVDNKTEKDVESKVPGYAQVLETIYFGGADPRKEQKDGIWERFWIVPAEARRFEGTRKKLTLFDVPLKVKTQKMKWIGRELVDDKQGKSSPGAKAFKNWFTKNYNGIAGEQYLLPPPESGITNPVPVFTELRRIALTTAIAEKLRDQGVPMPFWMRDYEIHKVPFEKHTPGLEVTWTKQEGNTIRHARIFGGVELTPEDKVVKTYASVAEAKEAPEEVRAKVEREVKLASELEQILVDTPSVIVPVLISREVVADGHEFKVAAMPGAETKALGPCQLDEVDVAVQIPGGGSIQLVRSFNSFFNPTGPWGKGWALNLPRLEQVTVPVKRDGSKVTTTKGYELITPLNSYYARFLSGKPVKRFAHPDKPDVDTTSPFIGMYVGKPDFFKDFETDLIRLKDGRIWHFSKQGDLIAIEVGALATVYERDGDGQITRIAALQGGVLVAQISMWYDGEGRLAKVTGVDLVHKDALPVEVVYSYNEEGRLAGLEEAFYTKDKGGRLTHSEEKGGRVGYEYIGPWVSSINWRDASADKSESVTLASYQYNENGQLVSEQRGKDRRAYFIVATRDGLEARVENGGNGDTEVRTQYDNRMRPVKSFAADGTTTEWKYGPDGKVKSTTTAPDGRAVSVTDSADGRERILQAEGEPKVRILYDDGGRMVSMEQNSRTLLSQQWRPDGQLARIETVGSTADLQYGDNAFLESIMLRPPTRESRLTEWQQTNVDRFGRPVAVKDCTGLDLQMGYDAKGNLSRLVQKTPDGNLGFNIERDGEGRVEKMVSSWGTTGYSYSDKGELKAVTTQRNGQTASVELSGGRIAKVAGFDGGTTEYSYFDKGELEGLLRHVECPNRLELENSYDKQGRLEAVTVGEIRKVKLEYDRWNRVVGYIWEDL